MSPKNSQYRKKIINHLYFSQALSCAEISEKIGKSVSLTTKILGELVAENYVEESGYAPSSGGRRPQMYSLKADIMYILSVAIDQYFTRIAVMDMHNNIIGGIETWDIDLAGKGTAALPVISAKINETIGRSGIEKNKILGIGMSMPGFVDSKRSLNYSFLPVEPGYHSIGAYIESKCGIPAYIDNDSSLIALAELRFGAATDHKNSMVVNVGWGIGLGMILNKQLFRGEEGLAGEFSHIPLFENGKICSCGKSGCLETEASLGAVVEKAKAALAAGKASILEEEQLDNYLPDKASAAVVNAANRGDRFAVGLLSEAGYHIGRGIAILVHLLNPGQIVLSGRGSLAGKILQAPIQQALNEHCIPRLSANTDIVISGLGTEAQLIGTAALVVEKYERTVFNKKKVQETA